MKKLFFILSLVLVSLTAQATIHIVRVWDGYMQFLSADITIQLGDTVQWLPLDFPSMVHTITSTNLPAGAAAFDQIWQAPADTFFQYVPQVLGLHEYECTPHVTNGMIGSIHVINGNVGEIETLPEPVSIKLFPNPANDQFKLNVDLQNSAYLIFSASGELIMQGTIDGSIDISQLSSGSYVIRIIGDKPKALRFQKN